MIVVDNGSAPDVEQWLLAEEQRRPELRQLRYAQPLGFAAAANRGADLATGEILIPLNSDTVVSPWVGGRFTPKWSAAVARGLDASRLA